MSSRSKERQSIEVTIAALVFIAAGVGLLPLWVAVVVGSTAAILQVIRIIVAVRERKSAREEPPPQDGVLLGEDEQGAPVIVRRGQLAAHGLLVGASGSGKTTSLLTILCAAIRHGIPVVPIDMKGSRSFGDQLLAACEAAGRPFYFWRPGGPTYWNPLQYGDATELKDKLISFEHFSEPHYQRAAERYLQTAIQVLKAAAPDRPITLATVVGVLDSNNLKPLLPHVDRQLAMRVAPYLSNLPRDQLSAISGLQSRLALLSESSTGAFLQPGPPEHTCDLMRALTVSNEVMLFSLNAGRYGKLAAQIAALVIQDLIAVAGYRQELPNRPLALIAIDEFSALDADNVLALVARAREAGISVLLCTQELADLERLGPGFRDQILGNTAITLAHRQNVPDSAELIAKIIGTQTVWKYTHAIHRRPGISDLILGTYRKPMTLGSKREVEEFRIHPNVIKELPTGKAILITKLPTASACLVRVRPPVAAQNPSPDEAHVA